MPIGACKANVMAEIYVNVYFQHHDPLVHQKLVQLFEIGDPNHGDEARAAFIDLAAEINPAKGDGIAKAFLRDLDGKIREAFGFEEITDIAGFCCAGGTQGGGGDRFAARCVRFLYHLCPGIQALAWGMGDDDPWEFWMKHEDGHLVRHDAEPFDGYDARIRSTIYRWWHEGLPAEIREGMLNDEDPEEEEDDEGSPVTEEEYQAWLSGHAEGSDLEDDVEELVMDELVGAFTGALASMFSGKSAGKTVSSDAIDADAISEEVVREVFDDIDACEKAFDVDGIMKHFSKSLKGKVTSTVEGQMTTMPLTHSLYRMSLKLILKEDSEYKSEQQINTISVGRDSATVSTTTATNYLDPLTNVKMDTTTSDEFTFEIIDGKIQITGIESQELSSCPAK